MRGPEEKQQHKEEAIVQQFTLSEALVVRLNLYKSNAKSANELVGEALCGKIKRWPNFHEERSPSSTT